MILHILIARKFTILLPHYPTENKICYYLLQDLSQMDAREKYEARAKNRKSIDLTQTNPDDPLHRSLLEQKQQERNQSKQYYLILNVKTITEGLKPHTSPTTIWTAKKP